MTAETRTVHSAPGVSGLLWLDERMVSAEKARASVLTHSLHYGTAAFEGTRFYRTNGGRVAIFRLHDHLLRMAFSLKVLKYELPYAIGELVRATCSVVAESRLEEGYLRHIAFLDPGIGLTQFGLGVHVAIAALPWQRPAEAEPQSLAIVPTRKLHPQSVNLRAKLSANYVSSLLAKNEATDLGADDALMLDTRGAVAETSVANIFAVMGGLIMTPCAEWVFPGITRKSVMQLANDAGISASERQFHPMVIKEADEVFITGTAAEITPIRSIDGCTIGDGNPGPITTRLMRLFQDTVRGQNRNRAEWLMYL